MKKRNVKYTNEPIGKIKIVDDFLPKPKELVLKEETTQRRHAAKTRRKMMAQDEKN